MTKICEMTGVREYGEGDPVELHIDDVSGHLVVVAFNEAGHCATYVDLNDLIAWTRKGPHPGTVILDVDRADFGRHKEGA